MEKWSSKSTTKPRSGTRHEKNMFIFQMSMSALPVWRIALKIKFAITFLEDQPASAQAIDTGKIVQHVSNGVLAYE